MSRPTTFHVGGIVYWVLLTRDPDTMVLKDGDSDPTVAVRKNGASVGDSVTVTKRSATTGIYDCSYNPASEVEGDSYTLEETAIVTGTTTGSATYKSTFTVRVLAVERGTDSALTTLGANAPSNWINAAAIASDAITDAKVASDVTIASVTGAVGSIASGGISASSFAAGAIDATAIATDAIGSNEISAAAVTKIQNGLATPTNITAGTITTVTNLTNLPAITSNWLTATGLDSTAVNEIADGVLTRNVSNVESTVAEHTLGTVILAMLEWSISGTTLTIKRTDGSTTHYTKTLSSATSSGDIITGLN